MKCRSVLVQRDREDGLEAICSRKQSDKKISARIKKLGKIIDARQAYNSMEILKKFLN